LEHAIASIPAEVEFLRRHDATRNAIAGIVDMPERELSLLLTALRENSGRLPEKRRGDFEEITDEEVRRIESAVSDINNAPLPEPHAAGARTSTR
jgi:hypothetical protein